MNNFLKVEDFEGYAWFRIKCNKEEGSPSTVDIYIQGFREV